MQELSFPVFKTKIEGLDQKFKLEDPADRRKYFNAKAGAEIEAIRQYLDNGNTFVGFLLGKKNSGKGTYSKLFAEAVGAERIAHISVGDIVRAAHKLLMDEQTREELISSLRSRYRGFIDLGRIIESILQRDTKTLLPTELILALIERAIDTADKKAVFIDGFPRELDQISYALYLRALIGYRDDPDFFIFIDVPNAAIDERIKYRVICPVCNAPRSPKLLRTKKIGYDTGEKKFYLICDDPNCPQYGKARMVTKEGDELGIEAIRERIENEEKIIKTTLKLEGVQKVFLRNSVPVDDVGRMVDDYELTPLYHYEWDEAAQNVNVTEEPWTFKDDNGVLSYSLFPAAVVVSFIKQTASILGLNH
jgi:adenylate kinase family enzyme